MALFRNNRTIEEEDYEPDETEYDDGFDELEAGEEPEEELTEEELSARKKDRVRFAFGAGNLAVIIAGAVAILVLLTLLFNMVIFVINDLSRNFSLFQTNL